MSTTCAHEWSWGYAILLSKFMVLFFDAGIAKSFGVLIPIMVDRLDSDYATVGLICSMPATLIYLFLPFVKLLLQRFNNRLVAMAGGVLSGFCILACAFIRSTTAVGLCLALSGVGLSMVYLPSTIAINDYFPKNFVFMSTITLYGYTTGSMLLPIITERARQAYGYLGALAILGAMSLNIVVCGAALRKAPRKLDTIVQGANLHEVGEEQKCLIQRGPSEQNINVQNGCDETGDETVDQRLPIPKETRQNNNIPCDHSKTHPASKVSLLGTCAQSCGILNEPLFLFSLPINLFLAFTSYAWMYFLVPHAEHLGIAESRAVFLSSIGGIGGVFGRTIFIIFVGKGISVVSVYITVSIICTTSFLLDFIGSAYEVRAILAFFQGFSFFIEDTVMNFLCKATVFDDRNFDMAYTLGGFLMGVGITCSGILTGYLFDVTQSFTKVFVIIGSIHAVIVLQLIIICVILKKRKGDY